jgi:hypothetical protein
MAQRLLLVPPLLFASSLAAAQSVDGTETAPAPETDVVAPSVATSAAEAATYSVGLRIGGYGFRRAEGDVGVSEWNECRMNGLGIFADRALRGPWFVEAGLDTYFSIGQGEPTDLPIDRQSALVSLAGGVRTHLATWLGVYGQLGAGVELARLSVPYAGSTIAADKAMPEGFFGVGADIRIARDTYVGAAFRMLVMANFDYEPDQLKMSSQWVMPPPASQIFSATPDLAAQGQFYLRRDL